MERFRAFVEHMLEATRFDSLEHMAFHFTMRTIEDGRDMTAFLADNQHHTKPELQEAFAVLWKRWQQLNEEGCRV
jgi:hypothetical protein